MVEHVWPDQRGENDSAQPRSQHPRPQLAVDATRDGVHCTSTHVASQRETAAWSDIFTSERAPLAGDRAAMAASSFRRAAAMAGLRNASGHDAERARAREHHGAYRLSYEQNGGDWVSIDMSWAPALPTPTALVMPRAIPMGYGEQRYDSFVADVRAFTSAGPGSAVEREEGPRWRLPAGTQRISYRVNLRQMERDIRDASDASRVRDGYLSALGFQCLPSSTASNRALRPYGWRPRWLAGLLDVGTARPGRDDLRPKPGRLTTRWRTRRS